MAMCDDIVEGFQRLARDGAAGRHIKEFLLMYFGLHKMMQPGQHEPNGSNGGPTPAIFVRPPPTAPPADGEASPPPQPSPGTLLGPDGQEYVAAG